MAQLAKQLRAETWIFLTLGAGLTRQKNEEFKMRADLADRTIAELGDKVTDVSAFQTTFVPGDVDDTTDIITSTAHGMSNDQVLRFTNTGGALPAGLEINTDYYVINANVNDFQVSLTSGGGAVDMTDAGTGTHTFDRLQDFKFGNFELL